jgi:hypothetical protein
MYLRKIVFIDESSLMYLYTQLKFNFDLNIYSNFRTYQSGIYVLGNLLKVIKINLDSYIAVLKEY